MDDKVLNRRRIQVGLLISHLEDDFDSAVCKGAMLGAEKADVNLAVFPGRYINGLYADKQRTEYEYQYNTLFDIPVYNKFDVLIALIGTFASHLDDTDKKAFLTRYAGTPIITVTAEMGDYPCIAIDNNTGMDSIVQHMISVHGCTEIGFLSGPKTNSDANERLSVYRKVLERNGIDYDENKVAYGNFSRYVAPKVHELLDRCPDIEAIVCANDQMASAVYEALEQRGLRPGKDILVTGFDDDPVAKELVPRLTTVKADPVKLGYSAVTEAVNLVTNGYISNGMTPSSMVCRNSCGCQGNQKLKSVSLKIEDKDDPDELSDALCSFLFKAYRSGDENRELSESIRELTEMIHELLQEKNIKDPDFFDTVLDKTDRIANSRLFNLVNIDDVYYAIEYLHRFYMKKADNDFSRSCLNRLFIQMYKIFAVNNAAYCRSMLDDEYFLTWQTNSITRDMLVFNTYDDASYLSVVDKLTRLHMTSSYLFSFEPAIVNLKTDRWKLPEKLYLKAYHNGADAVQLDSESQAIANNCLFSNPYLPSDRRYTMVVSPLFSNEEHYGLLMCEIKHEYFNYIQSVAVQLCAALKIITLMKQQEVTRRRLQQSLIEIRENNQLLSDLSRQDELTGCLNRRGFFEEVRKRLSDENNYNRHALMIFGDLDSLKLINDRFGHEEGDFAIRSAAEILRLSFGEDGVIGRIGGDEFVVCTMMYDIVDIPKMREYVEQVSAGYNEKYGKDKPYLVHISVGVYHFVCDETVEIGELLSHADTLLYEQKKLKKPIIKEDMS